MTSASGRRPVRLLYLRDTTLICGPGKTILNTWRTIDRDRFHLTVAATQPSAGKRNTLLDALADLGAPTVEIAIGRGLDLGAVGRLVRLIKNRQIDILQTHDAQTRRLGVLAAWLTGVRHITSVHGWIFNDRKQRASKWVDARLIGLASRVIAVSGRLRQDLEAAGVPAERIEVLRNSVLLSDYANVADPGPVQARLGIPAHHRVVSIIGRLSAEKGHDIFLQAAQEILRDHPHVTFLIVGDGPTRSALEELTATLGLTENVVFTGHLSKTAEMYAITDLLVISSYTEGIPNVLLEAYAYGIPAVATDVGGVAEVLRDGETGWLVRPGDPSAIAKRVSALLDDGSQLARMGTDGRKAMADGFSFERRTLAVEKLYDGLQHN